MSQLSVLKETFRDINACIGISGHEQEVIKTIYSKIKPYADEVKVSTVGNMVAVKKGKRPGPNIMITAHMDEVGYVVKSILSNGFLRLDKVGSQQDNVHIGRKIWITEKKIPGVMGIKPGHLSTAADAAQIPGINQVSVDVGCTSAAEVAALGIKIGDQAVLASEFTEMGNPDMICTRAVDNRINCSIIVELFKNLDDDFGGTLYGVFSTREEVGLCGIRTATYDIDLDYAIVLDTVPTADTPDYPAGDLPLYLGKGPGFPMAESFGFGGFNMFHPGVRDILMKKSKETGVNIQPCTMAGAGYCTDASQAAYIKRGLPVCTLAVPRRYSHSPVELFNLNDAVGSLQILTAVVKDNEHADLDFVKLP